MSRSRDALHANIDRLADKGQLYFWTFTFPTVIDVAVARRRWASLSRDLVRCVGFSGVRVFELHDTHGLHIHAVVVGRYSLRLVRTLCLRNNFGRVHVMRITRNPFYICKYVTKSYRADNPWLKGARLWAFIGTEARTRCKDIEYESAQSTICKILISQGHLPFAAMTVAAKIYCSLIAGDLETLGGWASYFVLLCERHDRMPLPDGAGSEERVTLAVAVAAAV